MIKGFLTFHILELKVLFIQAQCLIPMHFRSYCKNPVLPPRYCNNLSKLNALCLANTVWGCLFCVLEANIVATTFDYTSFICIVSYSTAVTPQLYSVFLGFYPTPVNSVYSLQSSFVPLFHRVYCSAFIQNSSLMLCCGYL